MKTPIYESAKQKKADVANANAGLFKPSDAAFYLSTTRVLALFWSVFGPAARYDFRNPQYAYAVSLEP